MSASLVAELVRRGVIVPEPGLVHVADDVDPARVEPGAVLHPFARLAGPRTCVGRGSRVGSGGPASLRDVAVGRGVDLASGTFEDAVFLDGAAFGPSGHARAGTLFEEGARAAHACGVKQTILLPFATLGSLINFCDCLLAGGTGPDDHSEVGSGFIHFNFSPSGVGGDKATPSLFGDAVRGVFLRERRIFLGGDGGVVGPVRVGYGTVLAAGSTYRRDRGADRLVYAERLPDRERPFERDVFRNAREKVAKNLEFLAEIAALRAFYDEVRAPLCGDDAFAAKLTRAAIDLLDGAAAERAKRLDALAADYGRSAGRLEAEDGGGAEAAIQRRFAAEIPAVRARLADLSRAARAATAPKIVVGRPRSYLEWVRGLSGPAEEAARARIASVAAAYLADPEGAARLA